MEMSEKNIIKFIKDQNLAPLSKGKRDPSIYIKKWLEVLGKQDERSSKDNEEIERIKSIYHKIYVLKPENFPRDAFIKFEKKKAEQKGQKIDIDDFIIRAEIKKIQENQKDSLDLWFDYVTSPEAKIYPSWAKFWALNGVTKMTDLKRKSADRKLHFNKREKSTLANFPQLNKEVFGLTINHIVNQTLKIGEVHEDIANKTNFGDIYLFYYNEIQSKARNADLKVVEGKWVKYNQGNTEDVQKMHYSLNTGYETGWCIRGYSTAENYLKLGDMYIYFTNNNEGIPEVPRIAIRFEGEEIKEISGIAEMKGMTQVLDDEIIKTDILEEKLHEFGDKAAEYERKIQNLKLISQIKESLVKDRTRELTEEENDFIYEKKYFIETFGYGTDPRVYQIKTYIQLREEYGIKEINLDALKRMIKEGTTYAYFFDLIEYINPDYHQEMIFEIVKNTELSGIIMEHFDKFQNLNLSEIFDLYLESDVFSLTMYLRYFKILGLDYILKRFQESENYYFAIYSKELLSIMNHDEFARFLYETKGVEFFLDNIDKLSNIGSDLLYRTFEDGHLYSISYYSHFKDVDPQKIIDIYIKLDKLESLIFNASKFSDEFQEIIQNIAVKNDKFESLISNISKFRKLNPKTIKYLEEKGYSIKYQ